jgi:RNase H-fold protein (predicted Holliday junction resolvase)
LIPVIPWDEWGSTKNARGALIDAGVSRSKRSGHQDAMAAAIILHSYLESKNYLKGTENE